MTARWSRALAGTALLALPGVLSAQAPPVGSMTFIMSATTPAALAEQAPMAAGATPTFRLTMGSDGRRIAAQVNLTMDGASSPEMAMLNAARVYTQWTVDTDSVLVGLELPEPMRAVVASMIAPEMGSTPPVGYQVSMKMPDIEDAMKDNLEKLDVESKGDDVTTTSLGTRSTVGGIECEDWTMASPGESVQVCVVERTAPAMALTSWFATRMKLDDAIDELAKKKAFNGRRVIPIRMVATDGSFRLELESASSTAPAPAFFMMPAGFHVIDPGKLPFGGGS